MRTLAIVASLLVVAFMAGCAGNMNAIIKASESTRQDVFQEYSASKATTGKALLKIAFPVKSFKTRIVNTYSKHSNPPYTVTINIDDQAIVLTDEPVLEDLSGDFMKNPEVGTGWKYNFSKVLLLEPGKHKLTIVLPIDDMFVEREVELHVGTNTINMVPVYNKRLLRPFKGQHFSAGVKTVEITID